MACPRPDDNTLTTAALGRPFRLGMLYDVRTDMLIPGFTLWNQNEIDRNVASQINLQGSRSSTFTLIAEDSFKEKSSAMDIKASLKMSILSGLIEVSGAGHYLNDRKKSATHQRLTLKYSAKSKYDQLSMEVLAKSKIQYPEVLEGNRATHIVSGIQYGGQAFIVFDLQNSKNEEEDIIRGNLKAVIKKIPFIEISGSADVDIKSADKDIVDNLSCTVYGDLVAERLPTTYREAIEFCQNITMIMLGKDGEKASPVTVYLAPLSWLNSKDSQVTRDIEKTTINKVIDIFENFANYIIKSNGILESNACHKFGRIKKKIIKFKSCLNVYELQFKRQLMEILPRIRGGDGDQTKLKIIINNHEKSPFSAFKIDEWLEYFIEEIKLLEPIISFLGNNIMFAKNQGDILGVTTANDIVICYTFTMSNSTDNTLEILDKYNEDPSIASEVKFTTESWYNIPEVRTQIINSSKIFGNFARINQLNRSTKFIIYDTVVLKIVPSSQGGYVSVYKNSNLIKERYELPSSPTNISVKHEKGTSIILQWNAPEMGVKNVIKYEVLYKERSTNKKCTSLVTEQTQLKVKDLSPETTYDMKVWAKCVAGHSEADFPNNGLVTTLKDERRCTYTNTESSNTYFPIYGDTFTFTVSCTKDAYLSLKSVGSQYLHVSVGFGVYDNKKSYIEIRANKGKKEVMVDTPGICCEHGRTFTISFKDGNIKVTKCGEVDPFMEHSFEVPIEITHVGVATLGVTGKWKFEVI